MKTLFYGLPLLIVLFFASRSGAQNNTGPLTLDTAFATGGKSELSFAGQIDTLTSFVTYQGGLRTWHTWAAGKIADGLGGIHLGIASYDSNGALDRRFGTDGLANLGWSGKDYPNTIIALQDTSILAAGASIGANGALQPTLFHIKANGTPDSSFGTNGRMVLPFDTSLGGTGEFTRIDTILDGKRAIQTIVATGMATSNGSNGVYACRLNSSFAPDPLFGTGGKAWANAGSLQAMGSAQKDSSVIFATISKTDQTLRLVKLNALGQLDPAFGTAGIVSTGIVLQPGLLKASLHGAGFFLVLAAIQGSATPFTLLLFHTQDGTLEPTFGTDGRASSASTTGMTASGFSFANDGSILVSGASTTAAVGKAIKFFYSGVLDSSFGSFGVATIDPDSGRRPNSLIGFVPIGRGPSGLALSAHFMAFGNPFYVARYVPAPRLEAPALVMFGNVELGKSLSKDTTVYNKNQMAVTITAFTISGLGSNAYTVDSPATPFTIPAGDSAKIRIRFAPVILNGANALLRFVDNEPNTSPVIALSGNGVPSSGITNRPSVNDASLFVVPNPARTSARIILEAAPPDLQVEIYDAASRMVCTQRLTSASFSLPEVPGIYLIRLLSNGSEIGSDRVVVLP
jgi:uncharacterized delta-60 repeat protein